jgi:hypothetical protein
LGYLTLPSHDTGLSEAVIEKFVFGGHYAFSEYCIRYWSLHLEDISLENCIEESSLGTLKKAIRLFLTRRFNSDANPTNRKKGSSRKSLSRFKDEDFFGILEQAITMMSENYQNDQGIDDEGNLPFDLVSQLLQVRSVIERLVTDSDPEQKQILERLYGSRCFKCPNSYCEFFHGGFTTLRERNNHSAEHQRSFFCTLPGCPASMVGYTSAEGLKKHESDYHGNVIDGYNFPWHGTLNSADIAKEIRIGNMSIVEMLLSKWKELGEDYEALSWNMTSEDVGLSKKVFRAIVKCRRYDMLQKLLDHMPSSFRSFYPTCLIHAVLHSALDISDEDAVQMICSHIEAIHPKQWTLLSIKALRKDLYRTNLVLLQHPESPLPEWRGELLDVSRAAVRYSRFSFLRTLLLGEWKEAPAPEILGYDQKATLICTASEYNRLEIAQFLQDVIKCDKLATNKDGYTAASFAAGNGHESFIREFFLDTGDTLSIRTARLYNAVCANDHETLESLLAGGNVCADLCDHKRRMPLAVAAENGNIPMVETLIDYYSVHSIEVEEKGGYMMVSKAEKSGHENIVRKLLNSGLVDDAVRRFGAGFNVADARVTLHKETMIESHALRLREASKQNSTTEGKPDIIILDESGMLCSYLYSVIKAIC